MLGKGDMSKEETKIPTTPTRISREKELKEKHKKLQVEVKNLKHKISMMECGDTRYLGNSNVAMENCVIAYRTPVGKALYSNRQELQNTYFKRGIQQDIADHMDLLNKMPFEYASDLTPLNKKVA
jgi:uncharacterized protein (DUF342 family)